MPSFFVYYFLSEFNSIVDVQTVCEALVSHPPLPEDEPQAEVGMEPTVQPQVTVDEEPTVRPSPRKRKGKEVASKALNKTKPFTPLQTGGTLKVDGEVANPPPVAEEGGDRPVAPASRPTAEADQIPQASPRPAPTTRSDRRATDGSAPSQRAPKPTKETPDAVPTDGAALGTRKRKFKLRVGST